MQIEDLRRSINDFKFEDLLIGDVFTSRHEDGVYYMKILSLTNFDGDHKNAINLNTYNLVFISDEMLVKVVNAKLVIED